MKSSLIETNDVWMPRQALQKYQCMKLQRLREQRDRMENMRDMVEKYSQIINDLEFRNKQLLKQNQQLKVSQSIYWQHSRKDIDYYNLQQKYSKICIQLEKQKKMRENCELTIENLRKQLLTTDLSINLPAYITTQQIKRKQIQTDYNLLIGLYDQLKKEVYFLEKQNLTLKQVIRDQSKTSYAKQSFWKQNIRPMSKTKLKRQQKQNKPGAIRNAGKSHKKLASQHSSQVQIKNDITTSIQPQAIVEIKRSRRDLQLQIKKQAELIQKFKQTQQQQIKLIQILKSQKQTVCLCHSQGHTSSKRLVSSGKVSTGLVTFKKDLVEQKL